jgi:hypothetical protein
MSRSFGRILHTTGWPVATSLAVKDAEGRVLFLKDNLRDATPSGGAVDYADQIGAEKNEEAFIHRGEAEGAVMSAEKAESHKAVCCDSFFLQKDRHSTTDFGEGEFPQELPILRSCNDYYMSKPCVCGSVFERHFIDSSTRLSVN